MLWVKHFLIDNPPIFHCKNIQYNICISTWNKHLTLVSFVCNISLVEAMCHNMALSATMPAIWWVSQSYISHLLVMVILYHITNKLKSPFLDYTGIKELPTLPYRVPRWRHCHTMIPVSLHPTFKMATMAEYSTTYNQQLLKKPFSDYTGVKELPYCPTVSLDGATAILWYQHLFNTTYNQQLLKSPFSDY